MNELCIGDPALLATDVGPVIDETARRRLHAHIARMRAAGRVVFQPALPAQCAHGCFVAPTLIAIDTLDDIGGEVFGPVLHVLRFAAAGLDALVADINAAGYGLTLGVHSRIDATVARVVAGARVGNVYVNRNIIGAVVGVQPFGGEGLSGTGPKAGGPLMLPRLAGVAQILPGDIGARRQAGGLPPALRGLAEWAEAAGHLRLAQACADYATATLLDCELELPGPTGERNTLRFAPRGNLLCLAAGEEDLHEQLAAALASGNRPLFAATPLHERVARSLPEALAFGVIGWRKPGELRGLGGVLFAGDADELSDLRRRAAAGDGPLLPVMAPGADGRYPLHRLFVERVVSVNTAAAGGNTALMTLPA
jgi:RHH-type proline utilization regulon transcriptional repressor/proline dehydrogenase/delta 1-pyrroline-5-carboxylate dehydrogenase